MFNWKLRSAYDFTREPWCHLVAVVSVVTATILTYWAMFFLDGRAPIAFFTLAVIISAARGTTTGLLATALSVCVMSLVFRQNVSLPIAAKSGLAVFAGVGIVTTIVFHKLHLMNSALNRAKYEVEAVNRNLVDQAEFLADANARLAQQTAALSLAHEQLRQFAKLSAHSIQAPLRTISDSTDLLIRCSENSDGSSKQAPELIKSEIQRIDAMLSDLSDYAAKREDTFIRRN